MPLSVRLVLDLPANEAVCDSAEVGALDGLALSVVEVGRASFAFCFLCRLMRSLVLILEGVRVVLFHTGEAEVVVVPPTGSDGNTFEPTEKPFNSPRTSLTGCNRTASCDVDFRVCSAESLILTTEEVRKMLFGGDDGELSFAAAACDIVGVVERAVE